MQMRANDLENLVAYQIAALIGISGMVGVPVTHVKPHGALHNMASRDPDMARAVVRGIKAIDPKLVLVCLTTLELDKAGRAIGLPVAREGYIDRSYEDDGSLTSRMRDDAMIHDPAAAAAHVVRMVVEGTIVSRTGKRIHARYRLALRPRRRADDARDGCGRTRRPRAGGRADRHTPGDGGCQGGGRRLNIVSFGRKRREPPKGSAKECSATQRAVGRADRWRNAPRPHGIYVGARCQSTGDCSGDICSSSYA